MPVMVFLKIASEVCLFLTVGGAISIHFGAGSWQIIVTLAVICLSEVLSYIMYARKGQDERQNVFIRLWPMGIPLLCILLPGRCISWAVLCGIVFAYTVYIVLSEKYLPDADHQKTLFKLALGLTIGVIVILAFAGGREISFSVTIFSGLASAACSILLMRSLRHDASVYQKASFQLINVGLVAAVSGIILLLSSKAVINGVLSVLRTVYTFVARGALYVIMFIIRIIGEFFKWLISIFPLHEIPQQEREAVELNTENAGDMFGEATEYVGLPLAAKIIIWVIIAVIIAAILYFIFRYIAGERARVTADGGQESFRKPSLRPRGRQGEDDSSQVKGVRKQYRKYLHFLKSKGMFIDPSNTSLEIENGAPDPYRMDEADELRELYLEARYNNKADQWAAERARELVKIIKKAEA